MRSSERVSWFAILRNAPEMKGGGSACIDSVSATYFRSDAHDKFLIGDFYGQRGADPGSGTL